MSGAAALDTSTVASSTVGGNTNLGYSERPTITYAPLSGSEFSQRMLAPVSAELMYATSQGGWDTNHLSTVCYRDRGAAHYLAGGSVNLGYTEHPTITYAPLTGSEFARRLLTPLSIDSIVSLGQGGWPIDRSRTCWVRVIF